MTDRELLEAAAKAAGMEGCAVQYADRLVFLEDGKPASLEWTPLTDDGDALRLAVKLGLTINPYQEGVFVSRYEGEEVVAEPFVTMGRPDAPATRRAITRAAAALAPQGVPEHG